MTDKGTLRATPERDEQELDRTGVDGKSAELRARFGEEVRRLRHARGLTQEALAERSDLSVDAIRRIEGGRFSPTLDTLRKLSTGLAVSLSTLFESVEQARSNKISEISDFLARRSSRELKLAWRVIRAMFDEPR